MSPSVGNFVHDLVEMAKAMEELPIVRAELEHTQASNLRLSEIVGEREESILKYKAEIERLQEAVRNAEVSRDDAELRFLEADDHISAFRRLVSAFSSDAAGLLRAMEPVKTEPVVEAKPEPVYPWHGDLEADAKDYHASTGQGDSNPTPPPSAEHSPIQTDAGLVAAEPQAVGSTGGAGEGVSVATDPTTLAQTGSERSEMTSVTSSVGEAATSATEGVSVPQGQSVLDPSLVTNQPTSGDGSIVSGASEGVSVQPTPTSAPLAQTGTGTEHVASASEEPTKFEWVNGIKQIRQAWFDWYDAQPYEFKQAYQW